MSIKGPVVTTVLSIFTLIILVTILAYDSDSLSQDGRTQSASRVSSQNTRFPLAKGNLTSDNQNALLTIPNIIQTQGQSGSCFDLPTQRNISGDLSHLHDLTREAWVDRSQVVLEGAATGISSVHFNTPNLGIPTPAPADDDEVGLDLFSIVVLSTAHGYKNMDGVTGIVMARFGGVSELCPGYKNIVDPPTKIDLGGVGMLFAYIPASHYYEDSPAWFQQILDKVTQLNAQGDNFIPVVIGEWFSYTGDSATSRNTGEIVPVQQLRNEVQDAVEP